MKVISGGRIVDSLDLELVDLIIQLRKKNQQEAMDAIVELFTTRYPEEVSSVAQAVKEYRQNLSDKKYGQTADRSMERRFVASIPQRLYLLIRAVFRDKIKFDSKFFRAFSKRYTFTRVAEKS